MCDFTELPFGKTGFNIQTTINYGLTSTEALIVTNNVIALNLVSKISSKTVRDLKTTYQLKKK